MDDHNLYVVKWSNLIGISDLQSVCMHSCASSALCIKYINVPLLILLTDIISSSYSSYFIVCRKLTTNKLFVILNFLFFVTIAPVCHLDAFTCVICETLRQLLCHFVHWLTCHPFSFLLNNILFLLCEEVDYWLT